MIPARVIEAKRDGRSLSTDELGAFLEAYLAGDVPDYQMSALLMAVYFQGLDDRESDALVDAMLDSGSRLDLSRLPGPRVDKHSTGGVGDKVSLALAPLAASLGLFVPMMSGRGLGHTAGTLDKLEAIPGFRTALGLEELVTVLEAVGCVMIGQSTEIAPLDRRLYALRDVTATVPAIPLIAASIMSKKLAEDLDGLVLDVKVGSGAFIPEEERALELARRMVAIGSARGLRTRSLLTAMDRPLGYAIGNGLETAEAIECLRGGGPGDLRELVLTQAVEMSMLVDGELGPGDAAERAASALDSGAALEHFVRLIEAQGGDPTVVDDLERFATAPRREDVIANEAGVITAIEPLSLGHAVVRLGGGRLRVEDDIDPSVGFVLSVRLGDEVAVGDRLGTVHARDTDGVDLGAAALRAAVTAAPAGSQVEVRPLVSHKI